MRSVYHRSVRELGTFQGLPGGAGVRAGARRPDHSGADRSPEEHGAEPGGPFADSRLPGSDRGYRHHADYRGAPKTGSTAAAALAVASRTTGAIRIPDAVQ